MAKCKAEFLVEPFTEGSQGTHVVAAIDRLLDRLHDEVIIDLETVRLLFDVHSVVTEFAGLLEQRPIDSPDLEHFGMQEHPAQQRPLHNPAPQLVARFDVRQQQRPARAVVRITGDALRFVRVGTLDNPDLAPPRIQIFTESKQPWVVLSPDLPVYEQYYDPRDHWPAESIARIKAVKAAAQSGE